MGFFKTFFKGLGYLLCSPLILIAFSLYFLYCVFMFILLFFKAAILFFKGEKLSTFTKEDEEIVNYIDKLEEEQNTSNTTNNINNTNIDSSNSNNTTTNTQNNQHTIINNIILGGDHNSANTSDLLSKLNSQQLNPLNYDNLINENSEPKAIENENVERIENKPDAQLIENKIDNIDSLDPFDDKEHTEGGK